MAQRRLAPAFLLLCFTSSSAAAGDPMPSSAPAWAGFGNDPRHTAQSTASAQTLAHIHWSKFIDAPLPLTNGTLLVHYATPMITGANTVIIPRHDETSNTYSVVALAGASGTRLWSLPIDYTQRSDGWLPAVPATLTPSGQLAVAGAGGTIMLRDDPDQHDGTVSRLVFYGLAQWNANQSAYAAAVTVNTPITADAAGDLFFGFTVTGTTPANLSSGIARIDPTGQGRWAAAATIAGDPDATGIAFGSAPALSADGTTLYVVASDGATGSLVALDATTLATKAKRRLIDPSTAMPAWVSTDSSASPTIAPDGDVYIGVLDGAYPQHDGRGWLLHFNATLSMLKTPGSFGWDTTASIVPAKALKGYAGAASYLLAVKYNNYDGVGPHSDGINRLAVLDPTTTQTDPYSSVTVLGEAATVVSPRQEPGASPGARYEWCVNSMAVDAAGSIIAKSEDGRVYRWDLATNTLGTGLRVSPPQLEAYTPTAIGPDGTMYTISRGRLVAMGQ